MDKRKATAAAAAAVAAASVVTSAAFDSPVELTEPAPLVEVMVSQDDDGDEIGTEEEEQEQGPMAKIRAWMLALPAPVRMLVGVPLWCIGEGIMLAVSLLWAGVATPLMAKLLGWLCLALLVFLVFTACVKAAFPHAKLGKLLRPRRVLFLMGLTALLAAADLALPTVWEGTLPRWVWHIGAIVLLISACGMTLREEGRSAERPFAEEAEAEEPLTPRETAMKLADSVCPPRF